MVTMQEIADRAKVSRSAVSAVLHGSDYVRVSEAVRERVRAIADEMDYVPNHAARSLRTSNAGLVAAVVPRITNPIYTDLFRGLEEAASETDFLLMLTEDARLAQDKDLLRRMIGERRVAGLLLRGTAEETTRAISALHQRSPFPLVRIDLGEHGGQGSVSLDNVGGITTAVDHLIDLGHERIAFVGGYEGNPMTAERTAAFEQTMTRRGLAVRADQILLCAQDAASGRRVAAELLRRSDRPTAIVANNVNVGVGVLAAAAEAGVAVPDEVSVVGYHDAPIADSVWPTLTTVGMPLYELGRAGMELLAEMIGGAPARSVRLDQAPRLFRRSSTSTVPSR